MTTAHFRVRLPGAFIHQPVDEQSDSLMLAQDLIDSLYA